MNPLLPHEKKYWARFFTHKAADCKGPNCPVHNPSDHHMRSWPLHYREDRGITERICPHGIGHPDPDDINAQGIESVHGCDGCCEPPAKNLPVG
jgi:hypothetical protein